MEHNKLLGSFGEDLAKKFLEKRGYKIVATNIKISYQEIDIIATHNDFLIFIEVKTRISGGAIGADETMNDKKLNSLKIAIDLYLENNNIIPENIRLDLVFVDLNSSKKMANIKHYKDIA